ncbi:hypothetical protein GQX74_011317 [Glossina fuscipes]|nr:hypothetical protein GQX74_011317 [Glossina fuscipes]
MDWAEELKTSIRKTTARKGRRSRSRDLLKDTTSSAQTSQSLTSNSTNNVSQGTSSNNNDICIDITLPLFLLSNSTTMEYFLHNRKYFKLFLGATASEGDLSDLPTPSHRSSRRPERHSSDLFLPNVHLFRNNRLIILNEVLTSIDNYENSPTEK